MEQAVSAIVLTFQEYAGRLGDKYKLCQSELKELLQKELPTFKPVSRVHHRTARGSHGHPPRKGTSSGQPKDGSRAGNGFGVSKC